MLQDPIGTYRERQARHEEVIRRAAAERTARGESQPSPWRRRAAGLLRATADRLDAVQPVLETADGGC